MSNIPYDAINRNFPIAGKDNDTKTFRDNFGTIQDGLKIANQAITNLEDYTAKINLANDFQKNIVGNAVFLETRDKKFEGGIYGGGNINFEMGSYQVWSFDRAWSDIKLENLPGDAMLADDTLLTSGSGKIRLELYSSDASSKNISFITSAGTIIKKIGFPNGGSDSYKVDFTVNSNIDPLVIDVWRHSKELIFFQYVGQLKSTVSIFENTPKLKVLTTTERDAADADAIIGYIIFNSTTNKIQVCTNIVYSPTLVVTWTDLN